MSEYRTRYDYAPTFTKEEEEQLYKQLYDMEWRQFDISKHSAMHTLNYIKFEKDRNYIDTKHNYYSFTLVDIGKNYSNYTEIPSFIRNFIEKEIGNELPSDYSDIAFFINVGLNNNDIDCRVKFEDVDIAVGCEFSEEFTTKIGILGKYMTQICTDNYYLEQLQSLNKGEITDKKVAETVAKYKVSMAMELKYPKKDSNEVEIER